MMPQGTEIKEKEVMGLVDVQVGKVGESANKTIGLKDGIVVEIR
ncbi:YlqD family protein [Streptococcus hyovaginalis]